MNGIGGYIWTKRPMAPLRPRYEEYDPTAGLVVMRNPDRGLSPPSRRRPVATVVHNPSRARGPATLKEAYQQRAFLSLTDAARLAGLSVKEIHDAMRQRRICSTRLNGELVIRGEELGRLVGVRGLAGGLIR